MQCSLGRAWLLLAVLTLALVHQVACYDDDEPERTGFEVASDWARAAQGFPEGDIVLDDEAEAGLAEGGNEHVVHAEIPIEILVGGDGAGFMQNMLNLMTGGFFGASLEAEDGGSAAQHAVLIDPHKTATVDVETLDSGAELQGMQILEEEEEGREEERRAESRASHTEPSNEDDADEFHEDFHSEPGDSTHRTTTDQREDDAYLGDEANDVEREWYEDEDDSNDHGYIDRDDVSPPPPTPPIPPSRKQVGGGGAENIQLQATSKGKAPLFGDASKGAAGERGAGRAAAGGRAGGGGGASTIGANSNMGAKHMGAKNMGAKPSSSSFSRGQGGSETPRHTGFGPTQGVSQSKGRAHKGGAAAGRGKGTSSGGSGGGHPPIVVLVHER